MIGAPGVLGAAREAGRLHDEDAEWDAAAGGGNNAVGLHSDYVTRTGTAFLEELLLHELTKALAED